ncbi:hypothetical protein BVRB_4g090310 isoform B [Beta vulgaris subsp. vulgaris]|nr:hypothetical protein BVRB_4g090310 isoform B [Beta vulgaris subsp. vulgaris]
MAMHFRLQLHAFFLLWGQLQYIETKEKLANFDKPYTAKKDKIVASENQPFTISAWHYNPETGANVVEPVSHDVATTKKDKTVASENQPFTISAWRYNSDTNANAVEPVSDGATTDTVTTKKDKTVASENQPWTVAAWRYNPDNINEKYSIKASHNHHHFMHNANSKDSEVKEENLNGGSVFFVEESLRLGMKLKHDFQKTKKRPYLPKKIAQSIPFSVDKVAEIVNLFSIKSESAEATAIKETLGICLQRPKVKKENRTCAQSMEDIVDFVVKELGTNDVELRMMRNNIEVPHGIQDYVVTKVKKLVVPGNTAAACHRMVYPYVVYYCHHQQDIGHYDVTLVSPTFGNAIQTTAVCHYDTYAWQPDVLALRYLGIRPGDAPVCHFSAINDMFWSIKPNSKYISRHGSVKRVIES